MKMKRFEVKAPGKIIISGEHAVVYGKDALVMAIERFIKVQCEVYDKNDNEDIVFNVDLCDLNESFTIINKELNKLMINTYLYDNYANKDIEIHKNALRDIIGMTSFCKEHFILLLLMVLISDQHLHKDPFHDKKIIIKVTSEIPLGFGLGSSGAYNVALIKTFIHLLPYETPTPINTLITLSNYGEKYYHSTPSGIDVISCLNGGLIHFININQYNMIKDYHNLFLHNNLFLINTGIKRNTKELIANVSQYKSQHNAEFIKIIDTIGEITLKIKSIIMNESNSNSNNSKELGKLIKDNQLLLKEMKVSNQCIDRVCDLMEKIEVAVKITGAGGGGHLLAVIFKDDGKDEEFRKIMMELNMMYYQVKPCNEGAFIIKISED